MTKKTRKTHKMRKVLLTVCCAALLVCVTIGATVAYLTSTDTVENTFTVGNVKITLDEGDVYETDDDGVTDDLLGTFKDNGATRVKENNYKLMPGKTLDKDPTVTIKAGSEACYVRVKMTINEQTALNTIFAPNGISLDKILVGASKDWTLHSETKDGANDARVYEFWYKNGAKQEAVTADTKLAPLFTDVKVPDTLTVENLQTLTGLKITIVAEAIQAEGFDTAALAWAEFPTT